MTVKPYIYPQLPLFTPQQVTELYPTVRSGDPAAIEQMITLHMRAALAKARQYGAHNPARLPDLTGVAMLALTQAVNRMAKGSLDGKQHNPTAYLRKCIDGQIKRYLAKCRLGLSIDPETYRKLREENKWLPKIILLDNLSTKAGRRKADQDRIETIRACIQTELEQKVIALRVQGFNDQQIGQMLDYSKARIGQIRKEIAKRVRAQLD